MSEEHQMRVRLTLSAQFHYNFMIATDNYRKHTSQNPLQKFLINNFFKVLLEEAKQLKPQSVLDVGCGEGFTLTQFYENKIGSKLTGIDSSEIAVELGHKTHPNLKLDTGSIYNIPYKQNCFDLVVCTEVLEHLEHPEKALAELERVSRRNCIISVPNEPWFRLANFIRGKNISRFGNDIEHIQHWSSNKIAGLIGKYFRILEVKNPFPWTLAVTEKKSQEN